MKYFKCTQGAIRDHVLRTKENAVSANKEYQ